MPMPDFSHTWLEWQGMAALDLKLLTHDNLKQVADRKMEMAPTSSANLFLRLSAHLKKQYPRFPFKNTNGGVWGHPGLFEGPV